MEIKITNKEVVQNQIQVLVEFFENGEFLFNKTYLVKNKTGLDNAITHEKRYKAQIEAEFDNITVGDWTEPVHVPYDDRLTPEDKKAREVAQAEMELEEAYQAAVRNKQVAELAQTDPEVAAKLAALNALKAPKNPAIKV